MKRKDFIKIGAVGSASMMMPFSPLAGLSSKGTNVPSAIDISVNGQRAIISNKRLKKVIRFSDSQSAPIRVGSLINKVESKELLANTQKSWFECVINNQLVKSEDPLWKFRSHTTRHLKNGGKELRLIFLGAAEAVKGLEVHIKQQVFPSSMLMREKIMFKNQTDRIFQLNKQNNNPHFIFPQYRLKIDSSAELSSTEFRMATWDKEILDHIDDSSYDSRKWDEVGDLNLAMNHMFHSVEKKHEITSVRNMKGPLAISSFMEGQDHFLLAYEHASQDNLTDLDKKKTNGKKPPISFLGIQQKKSKNGLSLSINGRQGVYLKGQAIDRDHDYQSVWNASGFYHGHGLASGKKMIRNYLLHWINEDSASREPLFYYNTWAMQRAESNENKKPGDVVKTDRILKEIQYASELGVDVFVLDAGWEQHQGMWQPNRDRLKNGLKPLITASEKRGMKFGLWFSPLAVNKDTPQYHRHQDWLVRDEKGQTVAGQGNDPVFCLASDFHKQFIQDCKSLIDQGVCYFKWDGINTFACTSALHHHGDKRHTKDERATNYAYQLPIYLKKMMAALTKYQPELIMEIDVTENRRSMVGLAPLSEGKFFWMNNGASWYGDYSSYRAKSTRAVPQTFADWLPLDLLNVANYPQNASPYFQQRSNVNSSLVAGHGFWGNLSKMKPKQRARVADVVTKSKMVLPYLQDTRTNIQGRVGASPEIYECINKQAVAGQIFAFSGSAVNYNHHVHINENNLLAVLNNSYHCKKDALVLNFQFPMADASREAFLYPNEGTGIRISKSTSWLQSARLSDKLSLHYETGAPGMQSIIWPKRHGQPAAHSDEKIGVKWTEQQEKYHGTVTTHAARQTVTINGG